MSVVWNIIGEGIFIEHLQVLEGVGHRASFIAVLPFGMLYHISSSMDVCCCNCVLLSACWRDAGLFADIYTMRCAREKLGWCGGHMFITNIFQ